MLEILQYPHEILRRVCTPVTVFDEKLEQLSKDMLEVMYASSGIGLSAPQVGEPIQLIVMDTKEPGVYKMPLVLINPKIVWESGSMSYNVGCLSFGDKRVTMLFPARLKVRYQDLTGATQYIATQNELLTVCLFHEIDHCNSRLMIDYEV